MFLILFFLYFFIAVSQDLMGVQYTTQRVHYKPWVQASKLDPCWLHKVLRMILFSAEKVK